MKLISAAIVVALLVPAPAFAVTPPVKGYFDRQTLKGFGVVVDDAYHARHRALFPNNGFQNQFTGIHAGTDIEFTAVADARRDVAVKAVADGGVVYVGDVAGYGGLVIVRHREPERVTSLYGHLRLRDLKVRTGQSVREGQVLGYLGAGFSAETSGARKHLHFGIHKGSAVDIAGHEQTRGRLVAEWYNPNEWLRQHAPVPRLIPVERTASPSALPTSRPETQEKEKSWFSKTIDWLLGLFR